MNANLEVDAVVHFHQILEGEPELAGTAVSADGHRIPLVHREYPTFFRFEDKNPTKRLPPPAGRGHYDTVILDPKFIETYPAAIVTNRTIGTMPDDPGKPFQAVVEFKLDNRGWTKAGAKGAVAELGKLRLTNEAGLRYFVVLMRYTSPKLIAWERYWPTVCEAAEAHDEIGSIVAVNWLSVKSGWEVFRFGRWLEAEG